MIRQDFHRIDPKRRANLDHKKKQFAAPVFKQQDYPHRLNFYDVPPTAEITLEQFEQWAIDRLKGMSATALLLAISLIDHSRSSC
jgi:DNA primase large subunit